MKLALSAAVLSLLFQEKVDLAWKFQKGQEHRYRLTQKMATEFGGATIAQEMGSTYSMKVTEVDEKGAATLTCTYEAVAVKANFPEEYDYDSEKDKEPPEQEYPKMMSRIIGKAFTMRMTPRGQVTDVKGIDKLLETMLAGAENEQAGQMAKQMFNDEAFKTMMQQMSPMLPEQKVGKGETWANDFTIKMPIIGALKYAIKSKLNDLKDQNALIDQEIKIEIKADPNENNPLAGLFELKDAKAKASSVFSLEQGRFLSQRSVMEMTLSAQGNDVPVKAETEMKLADKAKKNF
jgi:hypothetical protein